MTTQDLDVIATTGKYKGEDREAIWRLFTGSKPSYMAHPWLKYTRYFEASEIYKTLVQYKENISQLKMLDYGAGVGDYAMFFGREGAEVFFYDNQEHNAFEDFRLSLEPKIKGKTIPCIADTDELPTVGLVVFGEVLEHLENPLAVIKRFVDSETKYIFTSSYPFRSDNPNDPYWHHRGHTHMNDICAMQKPCRELLSEFYTEVRYDGEGRLWIRK